MQMWKLKREFFRLIEQLFGVFESLYEERKQKNYELNRGNINKVTEGFLEIDKKEQNIAIYLIYQPDGLSHSHIVTCSYLKFSGYIPVVVSNAQLSLKDKEKLKPFSLVIIERPNYGYDFGGYREGMFYILNNKIKPDKLIIMNDSIWFPFPENQNPIAQAEKYPADIVGLLTAEGSRKQIKENTAKPAFVCSFFMFFNNNVLQSNCFYDFWKNYRMTNSKFKTIRRGERGLSYALHSAGFSLGGITNRKLFDSMLNKMNEHQVSESFASLVSLNKDINSKTTVEEKRKIIYEETCGQNYPSLFPWIFFNEIFPGYFKKSTDFYNLESMKNICSIIQESGAVVSKEVFLEIYNKAFGSKK